MRVRSFGILLCGLGLFIVAGTVLPLRYEVQNRTPQIVMYEGTSVGGIVAIVFGLPMAICGERARELRRMHEMDLREIPLWMWTTFLGSIAAGFIAIVLLHLYVKSEGYMLYRSRPTQTSGAPEVSLQP